MTIQVTGAGQAATALRATRYAIQTGNRRLIRNTGLKYLTAVRAAATTGHHPPGANHIPGTGPGPNVASGDYRRSMELVTDEIGATVSSEVRSDAVQAWRLERGFIGRDSLGRYYRQKPHPHWRPTEYAITPVFRAEAELLVDQIVNSYGGTR